MLDFTQTHILEAKEVPVKEGYTVTAEGQAVVWDHSGGTSGVRPSAGAAGEKLYGFSLAQQMTLLQLPNVVEFVVDGDYVLPNIPLGGTILVYDVTEDAPLAAGSGSGEYVLDDRTLSFNASEEGHTVRVQYRYNPTTLQALLVQGDIPPGGAASLTLGSIGAVIRGQVATDQWDTSVNWNVANPEIRLGTDGRITLGGSGTLLDKVSVVSIPTSESSYLVLQV